MYLNAKFKKLVSLVCLKYFYGKGFVSVFNLLD